MKIIKSSFQVAEVCGELTYEDNFLKSYWTQLDCIE